MKKYLTVIFVSCGVCAFSTDINANSEVSTVITAVVSGAESDDVNNEAERYKELSNKFNELLEKNKEIDSCLFNIATEYIGLVSKEEKLKRRRLIIAQEMHRLEKQIAQAGYGHLINIRDMSDTKVKLNDISQESKEMLDVSEKDLAMDADADIVPTVTLSGFFIDVGDFVQPVFERIYNFFHKKPWLEVQKDAKKVTIYNVKDVEIVNAKH